MRTIQTISITTQKGGVGKTATALTLAAGLEKRGYKTLLIDSDPQCNATFASGIDPAGDHRTLYDLYERACSASDVLLDTEAGYKLIPGSLRLTTADLKYSGTLNREYILRKALKSIDKLFDYAVIDTPPQIGLLVENALVITDKLIIPATADAFSIQGLLQYSELLGELKNAFEDNLHFEVAGILLTRYSDRTNISRTLSDSLYEIAEHLHTKVFTTRIREAVAVRESSLARQNIFTSHPTAAVTKDYDNFINEFLEGGS